MQHSHVQSGQRFRPSAATHNAFVDAANDFARRNRSQKPGSPRESLPAGQHRVRNDSGITRPRFASLAINGVLTATSSSIEQLRYGPVVKGVTPAPATTAAHSRNFVVLDQPVAAGRIGIAFIDGITVASVNVSDLTHGFVAVTAGVDLISAESGPAKLLWAPAIGLQDCLVQLGAASGGGSEHYRFTLTSDLSTGTGTADIYDMDGTTLVESAATIKIGFRDINAMLTGDGGLCFKQKGTYYSANGNCEGTGA